MRLENVIHWLEIWSLLILEAELVAVFIVLVLIFIHQIRMR